MPVRDQPHQHIQGGADHQGDQDGRGNVALRVLGFLRRHRHGLEADIGEKDDARGRQDAADAIFAPHASIGRDERRQMARRHIRQPEQDHQQHDGHFYQHHGAVEARGFAHPHHQQGGQRQHQHQSGQVDDRAGEMHRAQIGARQRRVGEGGGKGDAEARQQIEEIGRPAHRHSRSGDAIFQHHVPADKPRHKAAHGGVSVGIGAAGMGNHAGKFGIAKPGKETAGAGDDEGQHHGGPGMLRRRRAGDHENARPDHRTDADQGEIEGSQRPAQLMLVGDDRIDNLQRLVAHGATSASGRSSACGRDVWHKRNTPPARSAPTG